MSTTINPYGMHVQSDLNHVHDPELYNVKRIKNQGLVCCQCCITGIDSDDPAIKIFRYETETPASIISKKKTVYCSNCLDHIGIVTCPTIRGIAPYKVVNATIVDKIMKKK
jgi:hypothetical protein